MYSLVYEGKVLDFHYKKQTDSIYAFYVGDILVGQVFRMRRNQWSCVGWKGGKLEGGISIYPVDGFKTRFHASDFMLKAGGFYE